MNGINRVDVSPPSPRLKTDSVSETLYYLVLFGIGHNGQSPKTPAIPKDKIIRNVNFKHKVVSQKKY